MWEPMKPRPPVTSTVCAYSRIQTHKVRAAIFESQGGTTIRWQSQKIRPGLRTCLPIPEAHVWWQCDACHRVAALFNTEADKYREGPAASEHVLPNQTRTFGSTALTVAKVVTTMEWQMHTSIVWKSSRMQVSPRAPVVTKTRIEEELVLLVCNEKMSETTSLPHRALSHHYGCDHQ